MNLSLFLLKRLIRLYPLYLFALVIAFFSSMKVPFYASVLRPEKVESFFVTVAMALLFLPVPQTLFGERLHLFQPDPPVWSIFFELFVNLLFAITYRKYASKYLGFLLAIGIPGLMFCVLKYTTLDVGWSAANFLGGALRVLFAFPLGVVLYHFWRPGASRFPSLFFPTLVLALLCLPAAGSHQGFIDALFALIFVPALVYGAACVEPEWGPLRIIYRALGRASYALYIIHVPILAVLTISAVHPRGTAAEILVVTALLGISLILDQWYDGPVRRLLLNTRWISSRLVKE